MAVKKTTKVENNNELQKQLDDLKSTLAMLVNAMSVKPAEEAKVSIEETNNEYNNTEELVCKNIQDNKYIKVVSLENNTLILSTEGYGRGKIYEFQQFGQSKNITYNNLVEILYSQERFAKEGRFYIYDKDVVANHELLDVYKNILTKEQIENMLSYDEKTMETLFKRTTTPQRETIISLVMAKLNAGEVLDLNKVGILSKIYGFDITQNRSK